MAEKRGRTAKKAGASSRSKTTKAKSSKPVKSVRTSKARAQSARVSKSSGVSRSAKANPKKHVQSKPAKNSSSSGRSMKTNIRLVLNNLIIFVLLFIISVILAQVFTSAVPGSGDVLGNLFAIFAIAFAFISVAFLITLLVFWFMKLMHKKQ